MAADSPIRPLSALECVSPAVARTEAQMFHPVRWSVWWRMAMLALATGEAASQGGANFNRIGDLNKIGDAGGSGVQLPSLPEISGLPHAQMASIITVVIVGIVVLAFTHLYVSSVARFMLLDAVATRRLRLREGWSRWHSHGIRYFGFQLLLSLFGLMVLAVPLVIAWRAGVFSDFRAHWTTLLAELVVMAPLFLLLGIVGALFHVFLKDFVVPVMALEDITLFDAMQRAWSIVRGTKADFAIYVLVKIGLAIVIGIGLTIIFVIFAIVIAIPTAIIALMLGIGSPHLFQQPFTLALVITFFLFALVPVMFLAGLITSPVVVFYQSFVMEFFGRRYAPLWVFMHPEGVPNVGPPVTPLGGGHDHPPYDIIPPEPAG